MLRGTSALTRAVAGFAVVGVVALGVAACGSSTKSTGSKASGSGKTLVVENNPQPNFTQTFNPFAATSTGKSQNALALFYEPLMQFNNTKAGQTYPWLAKSYTWSTDGKSITFTLRDGVKWSDGQPFTADDVAYTFTLMQQNKALNYDGVPITGATTSGTNSVTISFSAPEFTNIYAIAGQTWIVPKHVWSQQSDPATWTDPNPIGTGPYLMDKFTAQGFTLKANPSYWGGTPSVPRISFPAYSSNDVALTAMSNGEIDYGGNNINNIEKNFVAKDPAHNHYFFPATNTVVLIPNVTKWPFSEQAVRLAVSAGINRQQLSTQGETGYEPPATSSSGLLLPNFQANVPQSMAGDLAPTPDANKVNSIMTAGGFAKDSKGIWAKGGKEVSFAVEDPTSYTDYYADAQIIAQNLKPLGFDVKVNGVTPDQWNNDLSAGTFDSAIHWGAGGPTAYTQYDGWLDFNLVSGSTASGDQGRWNDAATQSALAEFAAAATPDAQQAAINKVATIVSTQMPVIPLLYGAGWFEYSTKNYTGWPTKDNSYIDPSPNQAQVEYVILQLKPAV
ncbi:MAG TPA: ABC transporter substrate-binding protein [Micromonosporaceae bacterium]|jgi:peptide/nickel transport system substrate-binding protein|nr:ABC transporter substrate-binding protein [Micromonosporaceae bacterium]